MHLLSILQYFGRPVVEMRGPLAGTLVLAVAVVCATFCTCAIAGAGDDDEPVAIKRLTAETFEHLTQASTGGTTGDWLVHFSLGYTNSVEPSMAKAAAALRERNVIVASVDCVDPAHKVFCEQRFGVFQHVASSAEVVALFSRGRMFSFHSESTNMYVAPAVHRAHRGHECHPTHVASFRAATQQVFSHLWVPHTATAPGRTCSIPTIRLPSTPALPDDGGADDDVPTLCMPIQKMPRHALSDQDLLDLAANHRDEQWRESHRVASVPTPPPLTLLSPLWYYLERELKVWSVIQSHRIAALTVFAVLGVAAGIGVGLFVSRCLCPSISAPEPKKEKKPKKQTQKAHGD